MFILADQYKNFLLPHIGIGPKNPVLSFRQTVMLVLDYSTDICGALEERRFIKSFMMQVYL